MAASVTKNNPLTPVLVAFSRGLELVAPQQAQAIARLADIVRPWSPEQFTSLRNADKAASPPVARSQRPSAGDINVEAILLCLQSVHDVLVAADPKKRDAVVQLRSLMAFFSRYRESETLGPALEMLRAAMDPMEKVRAFAARLKADSTTDRFEDTFAELQRAGLSSADLVQVALLVYGGIPRKTSGKAALAFIRKPHDAYMNAKRGLMATGGRTAA